MPYPAVPRCSYIVILWFWSITAEEQQTHRANDSQQTLTRVIMSDCQQKQ